MCHSKSYQMRGYYGNRVETFHGNHSNAPQQQRGREMGPVYGVEDKRKNIWRSVPGIQYG